MSLLVGRIVKGFGAQNRSRSRAETSVWLWALIDFGLASITGSACVLFVIDELMSWTSRSYMNLNLKVIANNWLHNCHNPSTDTKEHNNFDITFDILSTLTVPVVLLVGFYFLDKYLFFKTYEDSSPEKKLFAFRSFFAVKTVTLIVLNTVCTIFHTNDVPTCAEQTKLFQVEFFQKFTTTGLPFIPLIFLMFYVIEMHLFRLFVSATSQKDMQRTLDWLMLRTILSAVGLLFTILYLSLSKANGFWMSFIFFVQIITFIYKPIEIIWTKDYLSELTFQVDKTILVV